MAESERWEYPFRADGTLPVDDCEGVTSCVLYVFLSLVEHSFNTDWMAASVPDTNSRLLRTLCRFARNYTPWAAICGSIGARGKSYHATAALIPNLLLEQFNSTAGPKPLPHPQLRVLLAEGTTNNPTFGATALTVPYPPIRNLHVLPRNDVTHAKIVLATTVDNVSPFSPASYRCIPVSSETAFLDCVFALIAPTTHMFEHAPAVYLCQNNAQAYWTSESLAKLDGQKPDKTLKAVFHPSAPVVVPPAVSPMMVRAGLAGAGGEGGG